jgi:Lhr-like helicase
MADLLYKPDTRSFLNRRIGDRIRIGGEEYNIVAITQNEVVLSASNGKKYTVRYGAGPGTDPTP